MIRENLTGKIQPVFGLITLLVLLLVAACQSAYYKTMEQFGYEKRDLLVSRIDQARDAQEQAKVQFQSALEQFLVVTGYEGGELEEKYRKFKSDFEKSEERAEAVRRRIASVEQVAGDLFAEWESELEAYSSQRLRASSERQLRETERRYQRLIGAMRRAESKLDPVLATFRDQVLFLKHNLNAQAIASLRTDTAEIEADIRALIREMNASIAEAEAFVTAMSNE